MRRIVLYFFIFALSVFFFDGSSWAGKAERRAHLRVRKAQSFSPAALPGERDVFLARFTLTALRGPIQIPRFALRINDNEFGVLDHVYAYRVSDIQTMHVGNAPVQWMVGPQTVAMDFGTFSLSQGSSVTLEVRGSLAGPRYEPPFDRFSVPIDRTALEAEELEASAIRVDFEGFVKGKDCATIAVSASGLPARICKPVRGEYLRTVPLQKYFLSADDY